MPTADGWKSVDIGRVFTPGQTAGGGPYTAKFSDIAVEGAPAVSVVAPRLAIELSPLQYILRGKQLILRAAPTNQPLDVSLIDLHGRVVMRCTTKQQAVALPRLTPGVFTVRITDATGNAALGTGRHGILVY